MWLDVSGSSRITRSSGIIGILLGIGVLYTAWGSGPFVSEPLRDCLVVDAGRPILTERWTIDYYNYCGERDDAYLLLLMLNLVAFFLLINSIFSAFDMKG